MVDDAKSQVAAPEPDARFATALGYGWKLGFAALMATFVIYVAGIAKPHVRPADLPKYWSLPVKDYVAQTGMPTGWAWVRLAHQGDVMTFIGIGLLGFVTMVSLLAALPAYLREGDFTYAALVVLEVAVLGLAACNGVPW